MATSSFFDSFAFADKKAEKKYFKRLAETESNPPKRKHSNLKYTKEGVEEVLKILQSHTKK